MSQKPTTQPKHLNLQSNTQLSTQNGPSAQQPKIFNNNQQASQV